MKNIVRLSLFVLLFVLQGCGGFEREVVGPKVFLETGTGKYEFDVEVAKTDEQRRTGLMYRDSLLEGHGMLFLFDKSSRLSFWMKNVKFSIDIVFIGADGKVLNVASEVPPCSKEPCAHYLSVGKAQYVLELNSGVVNKIGLKKGNSVKWQLN